MSKINNPIFIGVYDTLSSLLVTQKHSNIFLSGLSYTASRYGLPDIGFLTWQDVVGQAELIMTCCPGCNLLVDLDDGFGGTEIASFVAKKLENIGVFGIVVEDQKRPKKCGHLPGKKIIPLDEHLEIIEAITKSTQNLFVVARTDANDESEVIRRITAYNKTDVNAILVDGISFDQYLKLKSMVSKPLVYNFVVGGNSENLQDTADIILCSMGCISAVGESINNMIDGVLAKDYTILNNTEFNLNKLRKYTERLFN
ncbi:MAG: isocitrate lyase/PEP mutase family protein [Burkholderiales bacterium]|nr:isocitrate lyase/PEP mutase family protein [Burkholderiales bacterium]